MHFRKKRRKDLPALNRPALACAQVLIFRSSSSDIANIYNLPIDIVRLPCANRKNEMLYTKFEMIIEKYRIN